jgi:hypothetical protein
MGNFIFYSSCKERQTAHIQEDYGSFVIMLPEMDGLPSVKYCNDSFLVGILMSKNFNSLLYSLPIIKLVCLRRNIPYKADDVGDSISEDKMLLPILNFRSVLNI